MYVFSSQISEILPEIHTVENAIFSQPYNSFLNNLILCFKGNASLGATYLN